MNRTRNLVLVTAACMSAVVGLSNNAPAQSTFIGSLADWQATPVQTTGDKQFTYLTNTGSWSGAELFTLSANIPLGSYTLGLDGLSAYVGPYTLSVGYELLITNSTQYFQSMALDVIASGTSTLIVKDIFDTFAAFASGTAPGSGTWSLSLINSSTGSSVSLPPIQTIWVRDTISATPSGSILGIANTVVQLPEPSSLALAGLGASLGGAAYWRRRRLATIAT